MAGRAEPIEFKSGGEVYTLDFTTNSLCSLEDEFGLSISGVGEKLASGALGVRGARALFRAALLEERPEITPIQAGRLLAELGSDTSAELVQEAFNRLKEGLEAGVRKLPAVDARGRLTVEAGGVRVMLSFNMNAQAEIEDYYGGLTPEDILARFEGDGVGLRDIRAMFRAALIDHKEVTLEEAGRIMDKLGIRFASEAVKAAFPGSFPDAVEEDEAPPNRAKRRAAAAKASPTKRR